MKKVYTVVVVENGVMKVDADFETPSMAEERCRYLMLDGFTVPSIIERLVFQMERIHGL